jgi:hypothetical protein
MTQAFRLYGRQARPQGSAEEQRQAGMEKARTFGGRVGLIGIDAAGIQTGSVFDNA